MLRRKPSERCAKALREIKDPNEWRNIPCKGIVRLNIVKLIIFKFMCRINLIQIKTPLYFGGGVKNDKLIPKCIC